MLNLKWVLNFIARRKLEPKDLWNEGFNVIEWWAMHIQKIKEEKITCETYLDLVDELRNDEECRFPVEMNLSEEDLVVIVPQPVTLAPPSACQIREKPTDQTNEWDLQNTENKENKKS